MPVRSFEVLAMASGDLHLRNVDLIGVRHDSLRREGRPIAGLIGADLLSNSLVVDVDRDAGVVRLRVAGTRPPRVAPGGGDVQATTYVGGDLVVPVLLDGHTVRLALRMAAPRTAVWPQLLGPLAPASAPTREVVVDDTGTAATVDVAHVARTVRVDGVTVRDLPIATFDNQRYRYPVYDGVLGEDILSRYHVVVDKHHGVVELAPRATDVADGRRGRLLRWGDTFAACADDGCAAIRVATGVAMVAADPHARADHYRVVLEAVDAAGRPVAAPLVPVTVGRAPVRIPLVGPLAAATDLRVVDAAPAPPSIAQASR